MAREKQEVNEELEGAPACDKCGAIKVIEEGEWICPHCQGEIHFLDEEDED